MKRSVRIATRRLLLVLIAFSSAAITAQEPALQNTQLLGGKVSLLLPADFAPMTEEVMRRKYPSSYRPGLVYTNAATTVNVALEHTVHKVQAGTLAAVYEAMRTAMKNMHPSAVWFRNQIRTINGREFFLLELRTPAIDTPVRNIMVGTSLDDRLLMISFNCTAALEAEWMATGNRIIESITVK